MSPPAAAEEPEDALKEKAGRFNYSIIIHSDVTDGNKKKEIQDICTTACERHASGDKPPILRNNELCASTIVDMLGKKFGGGWSAVVGEGFSFQITHATNTLLYMYFGGHLAVCVWKTD
ncbi:dynein light chain 4, axonemal [Eurytemora carolleeae]|uniref:dynein light chain 4, axonemal n=1 Tax=Eurytemora carolleeae TaxID=1294199 RepID=UPI000C781D03|nr:dynein light chain 4, axonemal [Eurytemora carolleeae]|eukprot:XP_023349241.1 dynein light chain 4, axonemal-like [Eurytemora affinis]